MCFTIDGERLGELMIEYDIGVSLDQTFVLKKLTQVILRIRICTVPAVIQWIGIKDGRLDC